MASWAPPIGDERLRPRAPTTPLSTLLAQRQQVATPGHLPTQQAQQHPVSTPHALPASIPFGAMPPGQARSSHFTGGVSQNPISLTQPQDTMFQGPSYPSMPQGTSFGGGGGSPGLSALSGGRSALGSALSGGSSSPLGGDGATHPALTSAAKSQVAAQSGYLSPSSTPLGGGYSPPAPTYQGGGYTPAAPSSTYQGGGYQAPAPSTTYQGGGLTTPLSSIIAALAQRGQKYKAT